MAEPATDSGNLPDTACRQCSAVCQGAPPRCPACGSTRLIYHDRITSFAIAHIDCDAFYAAIEKRDRPELKSKPVIVGGGTRGVVATACYTARLYGVKSAMPMFKALKACPDAVVIKPDFAKYSAVGRDIRARMLDLTPMVEPVSIDEAYLDLSGTLRLHGASPVELLIRLQNAIAHDLSLTVSVGLSANKFLAKTASELDKPNGFAVISEEEAPSLLADKPVDYLHGVGAQLAAKLNRDGYRTVAELQAAPRDTLIRRYGETGLYLHARAFGRDNRAVNPDRDRKSVSAETTFNTDISDPQALEDHLWHVCVRTADRAKAVAVEGRVIVLKLKTARFKTITRRLTVPTPTQLARTLFDATRPMLKREITQGPFRLIGVGISDLAAAHGDVADLIDPARDKRAKAERAADLARSKFGAAAVKTGRAVRRDGPVEPDDA